MGFTLKGAVEAPAHARHGQLGIGSVGGQHIITKIRRRMVSSRHSPCNQLLTQFDISLMS